MYFLAVDLGSTNLKAALYGENLLCLGAKSVPVEYDRSNGFVEFDARVYADTLIRLLCDLSQRAFRLRTAS